MCQPSSLSPVHGTSQSAQQRSLVFPGGIAPSSSPQTSDVAIPTASAATSLVNAVSPPEIAAPYQEHRTKQLQVTL